MTNAQTNIRLPPSLIEGIDEHVERLQRRAPGQRVTRSDAVRVLLTRGLEEVRRRARAGVE